MAGIEGGGSPGHHALHAVVSSLRHRGSFGALNLYGAAPGAFTDDSITTGEILAQHAAVALAGTTAEQHFAAALASRDVIGQAKGIRMHRDNHTGALST